MLVQEPGTGNLVTTTYTRSHPVDSTSASNITASSPKKEAPAGLKLVQDPETGALVTVICPRSHPVDSTSALNTTPKLKREFPEPLKSALEPGAEDGPWGDLIWRMYGQPDGSLGLDINQEALDNWDEITALCYAHPPPFLPLPECHWPITHAERIQDLESMLNDKRYSSTADSIRAALEYNKLFNQNALCEDEPVYFQNGRRLEKDEKLTDEPFWMEGVLRQLMNIPLPAQLPQQPALLSYLTQILPGQQPVGPTGEASYPFDQAMGMRKVTIA